MDGRVAGGITSVTPRVGPVEGTNYVTITGTYLGNGTDVTAVTLKDEPTTLVRQSSTEVVVLARQAVSIGTGPVVVRSVHYGNLTFQDYTFNSST